MGLSGWLLRQASARPHALVITALYGTRSRLLVEAEIGRRGWVCALSPAEASLVVVCGRPGADLSDAVGVVWSDVPGPRALVELAPEATAAEVSAVLDRAVATLADESYQRHDALTRAAAFGLPGPDGGEMGAPGGVPMAERGPDRDGLTLDRLHVPLGPVLSDWPSGLVVDTILQGDVIQEATVRVLQAAGDGTAFWDDPGNEDAPGNEDGREREGAPENEGERERENEREWEGEDQRDRRRLAARLDGLGRFLGVAGWPRAAGEARLLRDRALAGASREELVAGCGRFVRRVRRSKVLAWMVRGLGVVEAGPGIPARLEGDVLARLRRWLDEVQASAAALHSGPSLYGEDGTSSYGEGRTAFHGEDGTSSYGEHSTSVRDESGSAFHGQDKTSLYGEGGTSPGGGGAGRGSVAVVALGLIPRLLDGAELAEARLIVASLDPDLDQVVRERCEAAGG